MSFHIQMFFDLACFQNCFKNVFVKFLLACAYSGNNSLDHVGVCGLFLMISLLFVYYGDVEFVGQF